MSRRSWLILWPNDSYILSNYNTTIHNYSKNQFLVSVKYVNFIRLEISNDKFIPKWVEIEIGGFYINSYLTALVIFHLKRPQTRSYGYLHSYHQVIFFFQNLHQYQRDYVIWHWISQIWFFLNWRWRNWIRDIRSTSWARPITSYTTAAFYSTENC